MIKIEGTVSFGWEIAMRAMRNPMNSWDDSDSEHDPDDMFYLIGDKDHALSQKLYKAGTDHRKHLRMIDVWCDITAPLYWWKEFDTYRMGVEKESCSTMHKIAEKEFTLDDFSHEHILDVTMKNGEKTVGVCPWKADGYYGEWSVEDVLDVTILMLNECRRKYLDCTPSKFLTVADCRKERKDLWWQMIQLLPSSYNQRRTVKMSGEVLANMYHARKNHKLDEWREFCRWIECLPHSELIIGEGGHNEP